MPFWNQEPPAANQAANEVDRLKATLTRFESETLDEQPDVKVAARNLESAEAELPGRKMICQRLWCARLFREQFSTSMPGRANGPAVMG